LFYNSEPFKRRQDQEDGYKLTGQVYSFTTEFIRTSKLSVLSDKLHPIITKIKSVDIDEPIDLIIAESLMTYYENS
jgi:CMP-N-acetylneuraminic acid synthetase